MWCKYWEDSPLISLARYVLFCRLKNSYIEQTCRKIFTNGPIFSNTKSPAAYASKSRRWTDAILPGWRGVVPGEAETTDSDVTDRRLRSFEDGKRRYYPLYYEYSR